jgi:hypothetical protein
MRFTSLSTLTNTLFISAVALVSLIPAANAFVFVTFTDPGPGTSYHAGDTMLVKWYVLKGGTRAGSHDKSLTAGIAGSSTPPPPRMIYLE